MKILLDTHVFIWLRLSPEELAPKALRRLQDSKNTLFLSLASVWELAIKRRNERLKVPEPFDGWIMEATDTSAITRLDIDVASISKTLELPAHHPDPFDRLLVAQAITHDLVLCTRDERLSLYDLPILRA